MKIFDISPPLHSGVAVWPGDTPYSRQDNMRIAEGQAVNLSTVTMSLHTGAHIDAPRHFDDGGPGIEGIDLDICFGPARLATVAANDGTIAVSDLTAILGDPPVRLLLRCNPNFDPERFPERFIHFRPAAAEAIGAAGVRLIGIDAPSVDHLDSKELPCHKAFWRHGTYILENLLLHDVPDGQYGLAAVPLRIVQGDASPVRAILFRDGLPPSF